MSDQILMTYQGAGYRIEATLWNQVENSYTKGVQTIRLSAGDAYIDQVIEALSIFRPSGPLSSLSVWGDEEDAIFDELTIEFLSKYPRFLNVFFHTGGAALIDPHYFIDFFDNFSLFPEADYATLSVAHVRILKFEETVTAELFAEKEIWALPEEEA